MVVRKTQGKGCDGTCEAKIHWKQAATDLVTEIEHDLHRLLGPWYYSEQPNVLPKI